MEPKLPAHSPGLIALIRDRSEKRKLGNVQKNALKMFSQNIDLIGKYKPFSCETMRRQLLQRRFRYSII